MRAIYRICGVAEWAEAHRTGTFAGSDIDRRDGFIHFSTRDQVSETAARYFSDLDDLVLVMVDADLLGHRLKWEPARGGALFPHLYGQLDTAAAIWVKEGPRVVLGQVADGLTSQYAASDGLRCAPALSDGCANAARPLTIFASSGIHPRSSSARRRFFGDQTEEPDAYRITYRRRAQRRHRPVQSTERLAAYWRALGLLGILHQHD